MNHNLLLEISLNGAKSSSCVAIDSARPLPEQEAWHHPRWFGTESCRVIICLCSITLSFCKPPPQSPFGDRRWVIDLYLCGTNRRRNISIREFKTFLHAVSLCIHFKTRQKAPLKKIADLSVPTALFFCVYPTTCNNACAIVRILARSLQTMQSLVPIIVAIKSTPYLFAMVSISLWSASNIASFSASLLSLSANV